LISSSAYQPYYLKV